MKYDEGQYVVYNGLEICRIGEAVRGCFDGVTERDYIKLYPVDVKSTYYLPVERMEQNIRMLLTKEKLLNIIDNLNSVSGKWIDDKNNRNLDFYDAIKSGDYDRILPIMNAAYHKSQERVKSGKHMLKTDKKNFELAKKMFESEIAYSFGIEISEVEKFIFDRLSDNN